jgi:hypothetical protein
MRGTPHLEKTIEATRHSIQLLAHEALECLGYRGWVGVGWPTLEFISVIDRFPDWIICSSRAAQWSPALSFGHVSCQQTLSTPYKSS